MPIRTRFALIFIPALTLFACTKKVQPENPEVWKKVRIDFSRLDENGLAGAPNGKVALHYEFCIPAEERKWQEVRKIDPEAQVMKGSAGRSGCAAGSWLVVGSTHRKNHKRIVYELASLPYVKQIQETFFE